MLHVLLLLIFIAPVFAGEALAQLESERESLKTRITVLTEEIAYLDEHMSKMKDRIKIEADRITTLNRLLKEGEKTLPELADTIAPTPDAETALKTKIRELQDRVTSYRKNISFAEKTKHGLEQTLTFLQQHRTDLHARVRLAEMLLNRASFRISRAKQNPPREFPLWDGKESSADYAKRVGLAPERTIKLGNETISMKLIPAGKFTMGSEPNERPMAWEVRHEVTLSEPFYMSQHEITQAQYQTIRGPQESYSFVPVGAQLPVVFVSWTQAVEFTFACGNGLKLPTEAQWEFACRAGTSTPWFSGTDKELAKYAWFSSEKNELQPVGLKQPNAFGLYDMHGNAAEFCEDGFEKVLIGPVTDPFVAAGKTRVSRGGDIGDSSWGVRSGYRNDKELAWRSADTGFRVACAYDAPNELPKYHAQVTKIESPTAAKNAAEKKKENENDLPKEKRYTEEEIEKLASDPERRVPDDIARPWAGFFPAWRIRDSAAIKSFFFTTRKSDQEALELFCSTLDAQKGVVAALEKKFGAEAFQCAYRFKHIGPALDLGSEIPLCDVERNAARYEVDGDNATLILPVQPLNYGEDENENPLFVLRRFALKRIDGQWRLDFGAFTLRAAQKEEYNPDNVLPYFRRNAAILKKLQEEAEAGNLHSLDAFQARTRELEKQMKADDFTKKPEQTRP